MELLPRSGESVGVVHALVHGPRLVGDGSTHPQSRDQAVGKRVDNEGEGSLFALAVAVRFQLLDKKSRRPAGATFYASRLRAASLPEAGGPAARAEARSPRC